MGSTENALSKLFKVEHCHNGAFSEADYLKITDTTSCIRTQFLCKMMQTSLKENKNQSPGVGEHSTLKKIK